MIRQPITVFNYSFKNKDNNAIDIYIDGDIVDASTQEIMKDWFGDETSTSYKSFRNQIEEASPKEINVWVNSPGGHVGDAMAMHDYLNDLENRGVKVNRKGRGIIASAATYLLMGTNSEMSENSFMMIHNVQMCAYGDIQYVENQVRTGRKFNDKVRDFYANHTGIAKETISNWMNKETWFTAQEAYEKGFVKNKPTTAAIFNNSISEDLFPYNNKAILNSYNSNIKTFDMPTNLEASISTAFENVLVKLGLKNKAEEQDVAAAITNFNTEVVNAIGAPVSEERITEIVNAAVTAAFDALPKPQPVAETAKPDLTNFVTKTDLTNFKDELVSALADKSGNETSAKTGDASNNGKPKYGLAKTKNRFSGVKYDEVTVK